jgi:uncharacterized RDD family membrane protein YckC
MQQQNTPSIFTRIGSGMIDYACSTAIAILLSLPLMVSFIYQVHESSTENMAPIPLEGPFLYLSIFGFSLFFSKDIMSARSIGKRLLQLQVRDIKSGEVATPLQCFLRNITLLVWPIELIMIIVNPTRRLGDFIAGTKVEYVHAGVPSYTSSFSRMLLPLSLAFVLTYSLYLPYKFLYKKSVQHQHINPS